MQDSSISLMKTTLSRSLLIFGLLISPLVGADEESAGRSRPVSAERAPSAPRESAPVAAYTNESDRSGSVDNRIVPYAGALYGDFRHPHRGEFSGVFAPQVYQYKEKTIFFPPESAALGQPHWRGDMPAGAAAGRSSVLALLAPYSSEFFYAPLSAQLHDEEIPARHLRRISEYREERQRLLAQLRAGLDAAKGLEGPTRAEVLGKLAATQESALAALEARAEEIRRTLVKGGFFEPSVDWNETRSWRLGDDAKYESYQDEYLVLRASAFFQEGLSANQRLLLRELASELLARGQAPGSGLSLDNPGPYFSFSPFTARLRLPYEMSLGLEGKINLYREKKDAIKQDLRNTIYRNDRAWLKSTRKKAIAEFVARQEGEIATLERLAEEIREGLVGCRLPDEPLPGRLSAELAARVSGYLREQGEFLRRVSVMIDSIKFRLPLARVEVASSDAGLSIVIEPQRGADKEQEGKREAALRELQVFNASALADYRKLDATRRQLRLEVQRLSEAEAQKGGRSAEEILLEYTRSFQVQENWLRYQDYRHAVLEPGLSPAQRRLLYAGALEELSGSLSALRR